MMDLQVVGDLAGQWTEAVSSVSGGMSGLGVGEYADSFEKMIGALDLLSGSMAVMASVKSIVDMANDLKAAKAVGETTAQAALGPIGWARIALALGVAGATAGTLFAVTDYRLKANLSNPSEATGIAQTIGMIA